MNIPVNRGLVLSTRSPGGSVSTTTLEDDTVGHGVPLLTLQEKVVAPVGPLVTL